MMPGMMLIDTNVFLSVILKQNDWQKSEEFLLMAQKHSLKCFVTDFSLYSICVILERKKEINGLKNFLNFLLEANFIKILRPGTTELLELKKTKPNLDFDDKIQYFVSKTKNLTLISYDTDFDKTDIKRLTPIQALKQLESF